LKDVYNKGIFAKKLRIHKENCDAISDVYGFMMAFRYDMQIQMNAFAHRLPSKDGAAIPDISVEQCYSIVRSFGEASWKDNLYAPGSSHATYDPETGTKRPELIKSVSYPSNQHPQNNGSFGRGNHQERRKEKCWNGQNPGWNQGYNYFNQSGNHQHPLFSNYKKNHYNNPFTHGLPISSHDSPQYRQYNQEDHYGYGGGTHMSSSGENQKRFRGGNPHESGGKNAGEQVGGKQ
jgi:hypothetical protein